MPSDLIPLFPLWLPFCQACQEWHVTTVEGKGELKIKVSLYISFLAYGKQSARVSFGSVEMILLLTDKMYYLIGDSSEKLSNEYQ